MSGRDRQGGGEWRSLLILVHGALRSAAAAKIAIGCAVALLPLLFFAGAFLAAGSAAVGESESLCLLQGSDKGKIPASYLPWLRKATAAYRLGPRGYAIVAAIHKVESDFGRSRLPGVSSGTNEAGAAGPGQFLAATWAAYGVDADGDERRDIYSVPDSVLATANYLHASGAPRSWRTAIFAYNHAQWYVEEVLEVAAAFDVEVVCQALGTGSVGSSPPRTLARVEEVARWIESRRIHYCWGGGHAERPGPSPGGYCWSAAGDKIIGAEEAGLDCSGAVRWLLVLSGFKDPGGLESGLFAGAFPSGSGRQVTIWSNVAHVFVTIAGRDWGTSSANFAHGPGFGPQVHVGFAASHPPGL
jgi:hypothetical protein